MGGGGGGVCSGVRGTGRICGSFLVCTHGWMVVVVVGFGEEKCSSIGFTMCDSFGMGS